MQSTSYFDWSPLPTVYCAVCRSRLTFTKCSGRSATYDYFVCSARHDGDGCSLPYLPDELVERYVAEYYLRTVRFDAERVATLEPRLIEKLRLATSYRAEETARYQRAIDATLDERRKLVAITSPSRVPSRSTSWPRCRPSSTPS
jgi:hypothetical protein